MANPTQPNLPLLLPMPLPALPYIPTLIRRNAPGISGAKRFLKVNDKILRNTRFRKRMSRRKNAAKYDPTKKSMLYTVPPEIIRIVYDNLDVPSRVSFSLTSKYFFEMSKKVDTGVTDLPTPVRMHAKCKAHPCVYANHFSSRRILLLMLASWMPRGFSLCWICQKYTKTSKSKWKQTMLVNLLGMNRIRLPALDALKLSKVKCHDTCLQGRGNTYLSSWAYHTPGATGGFEYRSLSYSRYITEDMYRMIEYDAGAY